MTSTSPPGDVRSGLSRMGIALVAACLIEAGGCAAAPADGPVGLKPDLLNASVRRGDGVPEGLSELPAGEVSLADVHWRLPDGPRDGILLGNNAAPRTIPVGRRADTLHFLHTFLPGRAVEDWQRKAREARSNGDNPPDRITVFRYVVNYADGRSLPIAVRWGEGVAGCTRDWWNPVDGFVFDLAWAKIAWQHKADPNDLRSTVVYAMYWPNPRPQVPIESVTVRPAGNGPQEQIGVPIVFGLTTEVRDRTGRVFFVATDGNDEGPGTFDAPWASLHKAAATLRAGDTVYVRGGEYRLTRRVLFEGVGDEQAWTRVVGYPGETATLNCLDALWDRSRDRVRKGWEVYPHDVGMLLVHKCSHFVVKNLGIEMSRARGFMAEYGDHVELLYNRVFKTYAPGIRVGRGLRNARIIGNTVVRPTCKTMASGRSDELVTVRKPPCEGIDVGTLIDFEIAHNEICWGDKEAMLLDGSSRNGRIHHNYVHDLYNRPWVTSICPNGYGDPEDLEIAYNIIHDVGMGPSVGSEGGGHARRISIHHNVLWDIYWAAISITGAWKTDASISDISIYNNTLYHNGYLRTNRRPAGGITVSFPQRDLRGQVENVRIFNNLIVGSRDYALSLQGAGSEEADNVRIENNLADRWVDNTAGTRWRAVRGEGLILADPMLGDPSARDFRLKPGSPAIRAGVPLDAADLHAVGNDLGAFPHHR